MLPNHPTRPWRKFAISWVATSSRSRLPTSTTSSWRMRLLLCPSTCNRGLLQGLLPTGKYRSSIYTRLKIKINQLCSYTWLLWKQPEGFEAETFFNASTPITNFNVSAFAASVGLGDPVGGSFVMIGPEETTAAPATNLARVSTGHSKKFRTEKLVKWHTGQ